MNPDFLDIIRSLLDAEARFLIVGAYALNLYVDPRATGDQDLWVEATPPILWPAVTGYFISLQEFLMPSEPVMESRMPPR